MSTVMHKNHILNQEADAIDKAMKYAQMHGQKISSWKRAATRISHQLALLHKRDSRIKHRQHERSVQEKHHNKAKEITKWIAWT